MVLQGREILLTARASESALSRRLKMQAMHGGIKVRSTLMVNLPISSKIKPVFCAKLGTAVHKRKRETLRRVDPYAVYSLSPVFP